MELTELIDKNSHLHDFDGGRIKCADPPEMKGRRPLHEINGKNISVLIVLWLGKFRVEPHYLSYKGKQE